MLLAVLRRLEARQPPRRELPHTPPPSRFTPSLRAKVEHPFLAVKRRFGYAKVRCRGQAKNRERLTRLLGLTNLLAAEPQLA